MQPNDVIAPQGFSQCRVFNFSYLLLMINVFLALSTVFEVSNPICSAHQRISIYSISFRISFKFCTVFSPWFCYFHSNVNRNLYKCLNYLSLVQLIKFLYSILR